MPANSVLAKAPYIIPHVVDTDRICITIPCPNDPIHIQNFFNALASLGLWSNYHLESDRRAKPVADVWLQIFKEVEQGMCNCQLRNGPSGIEQFDDATGTWVPIQGNAAQGDPRTDGHVDPPWPTPPVGQSGNCLAAANIIGIFQAMQVDAGTRLTDLAGFATVLVMFESYLDLALPLIGEVIQIATEMGASAIDAGAITWNDAFDPVTQDAVYHALQCSISCFIGSDGTITSADISDIKDDFSSKLPGLVSNLSERALWALFVPDFLDSQVPNGLMKFGKMSNISSADCSDCDCGWCYKFDFKTSDGGWSTLTGQPGLAVWVDGYGWENGSAIMYNFLTAPHITKYKFDINVVTDPGGSTGAGLYQWLPSIAVQAQLVPWSPGLHHADSGVVNTNPTQLVQTCSDGGAGTGLAYIESITLYGDGDNPFGSSNC